MSEDAASSPPAPGGAPPEAAPPEKRVQVSCTPGFLEWLEAEGIGVAFTTYQTNRLFLVGRDDDGRLAAFERLLDRPMGLAASPERLWVATRFQLWRFDQVLSPDGGGDGSGPARRYKKHDRLFVPRIGHVTGEVDAHDVHRVGQDDVLFVNTLYSCLARPSERHSFEPVWRPPWVSALAPEDRCHLNGLAVDGDGSPRYVTAVARTDERQGWRPHRADGGVVVDVASGETVVSGLSMPHSPRLHDGELYVFDSGNGRFGRVDRDAGRFEEIGFCPGYLRGLALRGKHALVGLSKPRDRTFRGLPLDDHLKARDLEPRCALGVVDLETGEMVHSLDIHGVVLELYDVAIVPETVRPMALGFKSNELRRTITFEEGGKTVFHSLRTLEEGEAQTAGAPIPTRPGHVARRDAPEGGDAPVGAAAGAPRSIVARTFEIPLVQALDFAHLTFPDLRQTARKRPLPDTVLATVLLPADTEADRAAARAPFQAGPPRQETFRPVGAAVSFRRPEGNAEVVSLAVASGLRGRGLGKLLLGAVEDTLRARGIPAVYLDFRTNWRHADATRALLAARGWSEPELQVVLIQTDFGMLDLDWFEPRPLPPGYEVFPWGDLAPEERREIVRRQQREAWYPEALSPFHMEDKIDLEVSVGLRKTVTDDSGAESRAVIGWMIAHRVREAVVQYTSLFVEEGHGKLGRGIPLIVAAARRQEAIGVPRGIFMVQRKNRAMRRLLERRMADAITDRAELLRSSKRLGGAASR